MQLARCAAGPLLSQEALIYPATSGESILVDVLKTGNRGSISADSARDKSN